MNGDMALDERYEHLEWRPHRWRKQLSIKGRKMTVGQFVYVMRAAGWDVAEGARQYHLPLAAAQEAVAYYERHRNLVGGEADEETRRLTAKGVLHGIPESMAPV